MSPAVLHRHGKPLSIPSANVPHGRGPAAPAVRAPMRIAGAVFDGPAVLTAEGLRTGRDTRRDARSGLPPAAGMLDDRAVVLLKLICAAEAIEPGEAVLRALARYAEQKIGLQGLADAGEIITALQGCAPPSVLPDISPTRGEIGSCDGCARAPP